MPVWLSLGVLNVTSSGCCCGVWTEEFWSDKNERQQFFRDLSLVQLDGSGDEHLRSQQLEFRKRLESGKCPYGFTLPMDVTWPSVPESAKIVEPMTVLKSLAVVYGYLPLVPRDGTSLKQFNVPATVASSGKFFVPVHDAGKLLLRGNANETCHPCAAAGHRVWCRDAQSQENSAGGLPLPLWQTLS
eukprot:symbB.v1.2.030751.t1/scaffold3500.1/size56953/3